MAPREPTLSTLIIDAIQSRLLDFHVMLPCKITKYTASENTVEVAILLKDQQPNLDGTVELAEFPPILDVPVMFQRCAGGWLTWPLAVGDTGMVLFADRSLSNWSQTAKGEIVDPKDLGMHNFSGAVFIPGLTPPKNPIESPDEDNVVLHTGTKIFLGEKGLTDDDRLAQAKATKAEIKALRDFVAGHTHVITIAGTYSSGTTASEVAPVGTPTVGNVHVTKVYGK